jgi:hypothetical protein
MNRTMPMREDSRQQRWRMQMLPDNLLQLVASRRGR